IGQAKPCPKFMKGCYLGFPQVFISPVPSVKLRVFFWKKDKNTWNLPGGVVEANESPQNACIREVREEIGIEITPERLLCIDYTSKKEEAIESLQFIFFGGILAPEKISEIEIATDEISAYQFLPPKQALTLVSQTLARRITQCLTISDRSETLYLEDQENR
ncbi:MAG: hypothetical protein RLZZ535_3321, partial [Cyanobacteriota bacterium]